MQQRSPSAIGSTTASTAAPPAPGGTITTGTYIPTTRSGFAKIKSRKTALEAPDRMLSGKADEDVEPKRFDYSDSGSEDEC